MPAGTRNTAAETPPNSKPNAWPPSGGNPAVSCSSTNPAYEEQTPNPPPKPKNSAARSPESAAYPPSESCSREPGAPPAADPATTAPTAAPPDQRKYTPHPKTSTAKSTTRKPPAKSPNTSTR